MANKNPASKRDYNIPDSRMLQLCNTMLLSFETDQADFQALDSSLDAAWKAAWTADILAAQILATNETVRDQQRSLTDAVDVAMKDGSAKWNEIKYFVNKAFPDSKAKQDEFGGSDYTKARDSQDRFVTFLDNLHLAATRYKTALIASKYSQAQIDDIKTIADAIRAANSAQDNFKKRGSVLTEERAAAMNAAYRRMAVLSEAAAFIYSDSPARRAMYVINESAALDPAGEYSGVVAAGASVEVAHVAYGAARTLIFENTGTTTLQFWLNGGGLGTQGTVMDIIATQNSGTLTMADLDNSGNHIIVKNTGPVAGSYKVTVGAV